MQGTIYIGIGASAGGLNALEQLVGKLPADTGYVYFIAQHLDASKKSSLVEILSRFTTIPVSQVTQECKFSGNHIYIVPAGCNLVYKDHHLYLGNISKTPGTSTPSIDTMFESLALYKKDHCVGVILTGAGDDGTVGIKKIKEHGGVTIAQSPKEAHYKSMPQSAIDSQQIDHVLDIEQIADFLSSFVVDKQYEQNSISVNPLNSIRKILQEYKNLDIDKYKNDTIIRRINKRMLLVNTKTPEEYLEYINTYPEEVTLLYQDILIGVTAFFRDKESFDALENELFSYLKDKPQNYELRIWSIACSSGEEAYSLGILISKISKQLKRNFNVRIFATDIDDEALEIARKAFYSKNALKDIDKDLLDAYFIETQDGYKVVQSIRDQIVFTYHNLLSDPPFINQDIISCRNLLIYILPETQQEIFTLFHYSLKEHGILFLGLSESTLLSVKYFLVVDAEHKIYKKEKLKNPPKISSHYFSKHLEQNDKSKLLQVNKTQTLTIEEQISKKIFDFFAPECILVDKDYSIVYKKGELPFVHLSDGFVTLNILENLDESLRYDVTLLLARAFDSNKTESTKFIEVTLNASNNIFVRVIAHPFNDTSDNSLLLLYFQTLSAAELEFNSDKTILADESLMIHSLTTQLQEIKKENYLLLDKEKINRENMQLLNEELQSSNEELQSSNEELETSNEELQSSNEELHTSILNIKKLKQQLSLILNSTLDGMMGLDLDGNHTFVNDVAVKILGFSRDEFIGKNGHQLWHHTKADGSYFPFEECRLHHALENGKSARSEDLFWRKDGTLLEVEIAQNPIIENGRVTGAVLSFHDITEQNRVKRRADHEHQLSDIFMKTPGTIVMTLDLDGNITMINEQGAKLLGVEHDSVIGENWFDNFIPENIKDEIKNVFNNIFNKKVAPVHHYKNLILDNAQNEHLISWTNSFTKDIDGNITGIVASGIDITNEEALSKKLFEQENLYRLTFEEANIGIAHVSVEGMWIDTNEYLSNLLGYTKEEFQKLSISDITYKDDINNEKKMLKFLLKGELNSFHIEKRYIHKNGTIIWVNVGVVLLKDDLGKPMYILKVIRDISEIKLLMYQLELERSELKDIIEFTPVPIMLYDEDYKIVMVNKFFSKNIGYAKEEISDINFLINHLYAPEDKKKAKAFFEKPFKSRQIEKMEHTIVTGSGEKRVGILNSIMLHKTNEKNKRVVLTAIVDITELQHKEELMVAQSRQAAMGDMLAMIAHQWRQPLSVISMTANNMHAQLELDGEVKPEDIEEYIKTLDKQTSYLSQTIDDFRNFFKPDKTKEKISFDAIFNQILTLMQKSLENNNITLQLPQNRDIEILIYPNQLIQVLINIINNAKDAIKEHNPEHGIINITLDEKKNKIILGICDNGGGIDPSVKDKLGEPYVSTKSENGTGLGLYMSGIIVAKYLEGKLYWDSDEENTCFYIELPKTDENR